MNYKVKKASTDDVEAIRRIAIETWWPTYSGILSREQITYMLEEMYSPHKIINELSQSKVNYLLLIEKDIEPVAFVSYASFKEDPKMLKLQKLYCLPKTQGKGYGKVLIDQVVERVIATGKTSIELNVNKYNTALGFYEKMGFRVLREEDIAIGPYFMNDYVMCKHL